MSDEKPRTATGYTLSQTRACERALVNLLRGFGTLKHTFRLVGGLVPRYLTPEASEPFVPAHAGTRDVDVVLNLEVLAEEGAYASLAAQLKSLDFERAPNARGQRVSWRWQRKTADHELIVVEFLHDPFQRPPQDSRVADVDGQGISTCAIPHCGIVHQ